MSVVDELEEGVDPFAWELIVRRENCFSEEMANRMEVLESM